MTSFRVHSFLGFMNRLPYLLLGSLGSRIRLKPVVACLALQLHVTHPPARRNPAFFESPSNRALRLLLMPGKRQNGIRSIERFQGISDARWPTIQAPVSPVCRSAMAHRAAPSIYALPSGDVRGNRARELLVWRACFQSGHRQWSSFQHRKNRAGPLLSPAAPGVQRRSTAPPNAKRSSQPIAPPCVESRCAGSDAIAADARKNGTGTPRGEGLTTRSRKWLSAGK